MKIITLVSIGVLLVGCATNRDDPRLQGAWHCNLDATTAVMARQKPGWTNAPPDQLKMFNLVFRNLNMAYSNGMAAILFSNVIVDSFHYRVVDRGTNYVVLHREEQPPLQPDVRIRFANGATSYCSDLIEGTKHLEYVPVQFDKIAAPPSQSP